MREKVLLSKNRKIGLAIIIASCFITLFLTHGINGSDTPSTIQVPQDYPSISKAIKKASPGDTILVDASQGPYQGPIIIDRKLILRSINGRALIEFEKVEQAEAVVTITKLASDSKIQGFELINLTKSRLGGITDIGILIKGAKKVDLQNNEIRAANGLMLQNVSDSILKKNIITAGTGVELKGGSKNKLTDNEFHVTFMGVEIEKSDKNRIVSNRIRTTGSPASSGHSLGIHLAHSNNNVISSNEISRVNFGINLQYSSENILRNNLIQDLPRSDCQLPLPLQASALPRGIWIHHGEENKIVDNAVKCSAQDGIIISYSRENEVSNNTFMDSNVGMYLVHSFSNYLANNILQNHLIAIDLRAKAEKNEIKENKISNNRDGILLKSSTQNNIEDNHIYANQSGITLYKSSNHNTLSSNQITDNNLGLIIDDSSLNQIAGNQIKGNKTFGIKLQAAQDNSLNKNSLQHNRVGILLGKDSVSNVVKKNDLDSNEEMGISVINAKTNVLKENLIQNHGQYGINIETADDNSLMNNRLENNPVGISIKDSILNFLKENHVVAGNNQTGIEIKRCSRSKLASNTITGTEQAENGILIQDSKQISLIANIITGYQTGIHLKHANRNRLEGNKVSKVFQRGIYLELSIDNELISNEVKGLENMEAQGFSLKESSINSISKNKVTNCKFGIVLIQSSENILQANLLHRNKVGIDLRSGLDNLLTANTVRDNLFGVLINKLGQNHLLNNKIDENDKGGILVLDFIPGELIVKFSESGPPREAESLINQLQMKVITFFRRFNLYHLCFSDPKVKDHCKIDVTPEQTLLKVDAFKALPQLEFAEPNVRFQLTMAQTFPSDERYPQQWYIPKIGIDKAWGSLIAPKRGVVVAIIDSGVDLQQPDLVSNLLTGKDFFNHDDEPEDNIGHGTFVAGLIGAVGNNGQGISGVNWQASLLPLKVADQQPWYKDIWKVFTRPFRRLIFGEKGSDFIQAMDEVLRLREKGVNIKIINFSARTTRHSHALRDVIEETTSKDILFVTAAGNRVDEGGWNNDLEGQSIYPCNYPIENLICVGASNQEDQLSGFSNYGPRSVDLVTPGVDIISLAPRRSNGSEVPLLQGELSKRMDTLTGLSSGTSFSAALTTGVTSLLFDICPNKSASAIKKLILESVDKKEALRGKVVSGGQLEWPSLDLLSKKGCKVKSSSGS